MMTLSRLAAWTLLAAAGFGLIDRAATAQDTPIPVKSGAAIEALTVYKDKATRGIPTEELPAARKQFLAFAKYFGDVVKHPLVYKHLQDPSVKDTSPANRTIPTFEGNEGIFTQLNRFIVEPTARSGVTRDRGDYIREFGAAFDTVLKPIINENPEKIVRINATRILADVCKTGATAFYPTVTELLKNPNTPTYIKYYAFVAARNLLAAYDVYDIRSRRHSNGWKNLQTKGAGDKELAELVVALEKHITDPAAIMTFVPNFKVEDATPDQIEVVQFIRRQAIRALGEVRFVSLLGPDGTSTIYPAYTLARVCVSDPTLGIPPTPSECAEAAIGLCNMSQVRDTDVRKDYDVDTAVEAVTTALVTFAETRAAKPQDKTLDWRGYGLRLSEALKTWRLLFDIGYNPMRPNNFSGTVPPAVDNLVQRAQTALLAPLENGNGRVAIEELRAYLKTQRARTNRKPLFSTIPATSLDPAEPMKK
jgi:hypothetical protein